MMTPPPRRSRFVKDGRCRARVGHAGRAPFGRRQQAVHAAVPPRGSDYKKHADTGRFQRQATQHYFYFTPITASCLRWAIAGVRLASGFSAATCAFAVEY